MVNDEVPCRNRKMAGFVQLVATPCSAPLPFINPQIILSCESSGKKVYTSAILALKLLLKVCSAGRVNVIGTSQRFTQDL